MKLVHDNKSIECLSASVITRKIERSSLMLVKAIGNCVTWKCYRNCEAVIVKELNPKEPKYNKESSLNLNDKVKAENMVLFVNCLKSLQENKLQNHTASHKAQSYTTHNYTAARITKQIPNIAQLIPPAQIIPIGDKK